MGRNLTTKTTIDNLTSELKKKFAKQTDLDSLKTRVDDIVATGGEPNVIEGITVNGADAEVTDKKVAITVPTKTSEITNDSNYQTDTQVSTAIQSAIAATRHASLEVAESVPTAETAEENKLYLVKNTKTGYYDIYALIGGKVGWLDDVSVDLSAYSTTEEVNAAIAAALDSYVTSSALTTALAGYVSESDISDYTAEEIATLLAD